MIRLGSPEASILAWLDEHEPATAAEIALGCEISVVSVRGRLAVLHGNGLIIGKSSDGTSLAKAYVITDEGRREMRRPC